MKANYTTNRGGIFTLKEGAFRRPLFKKIKRERHGYLYDEKKE